MNLATYSIILSLAIFLLVLVLYSLTWLLCIRLLEPMIELYCPLLLSCLMFALFHFDGLAGFRDRGELRGGVFGRILAFDFRDNGWSNCHFRFLELNWSAYRWVLTCCWRRSMAACSWAFLWLAWCLHFCETLPSTQNIGTRPDSDFECFDKCSAYTSLKKARSLRSRVYRNLTPMNTWP